MLGERRSLLNILIFKYAYKIKLTLIITARNILEIKSANGLPLTPFFLPESFVIISVSFHVSAPEILKKINLNLVLGLGLHLFQRLF